jgi:hypothetical protein
MPNVPTLTSEARKRMLARVFTAAPVWLGLLGRDGREVEDSAYRRVSATLAAPHEEADGAWTVYNRQAVEFPPFAGSDPSHILQWVAVYDDDGIELARAPIVEVPPVARMQPRFPPMMIRIRSTA